MFCTPSTWFIIIHYIQLYKYSIRDRDGDYMRIESEQVHYRTRFELCPYDTTTPAIVPALRIIYKWVYQKERKRKGENIFEVLRSQEAMEAFIFHDLAYPCDYHGGLNNRLGPAICVATVPGDKPRSLRAWALEYDEADARRPERHWHTRIGLSTTADGTCIVNAKVTHYIVPGYFGTPLPEPHANIPNFIKELIGLKAYQCCIGETVVRRDALALGRKTFTPEFTENLLSPDREIPLVLITSDREGKMPVKEVGRLTSALLGLANVYTLDMSVNANRKSLNGLLSARGTCPGWATSSSRLRIFPPHTDLESPSSASASRFYSKEAMDKWPGGQLAFTDMLNRSFARGYAKTDGDVLEMADIDLLLQRIASERARAGIRELRAKIGKAKTVAALPLNADEASLKDAEKRFERMTREAREMNERLEEQEQLIELYEEENERVMRQNRALEERMRELESDKSQLETLRYRLVEAQGRADEKAAEAARLKDEAASLEKIDHFPTSLVEELELAGRLWPDRIVVLPEAVRSAAAYRYCDLDEEWRILRAVATVLWDIYFGDGDSSDIDEEFKRRTGFTHTFRESGATNASPALVKLRRRSYKGSEIDITPHIKGSGRRDSSKLHPFRLHYHADAEGKKIVIGHCGEHLDTAGTPRVK